MASVSKIIYLISILVAIICIAVSIGISPAWTADANNTPLKANGGLSVAGLVLLVIAAILAIVLICRDYSRTIVIVIIVLLVLALICFIAALAVYGQGVNWQAWLLSAMWVTFICILIAIMFLLIDDD
ncbi:unnamed protein product [Heterobilharzia americana]|nr:unnamed protein product [Heterobilharzia americana]CAH8639095.1 unnamed protein product [Heterobilharzia americana]